MKANIFDLEKEILENNFSNFKGLSNKSIIGDVTLKLDNTFSEDLFDVKFNFKDHLLAYSELESSSISRIQESRRFYDRIEEYKKIHFFYRPVYKILIYACEYSSAVASQNIRIVIDNFRVNFGGTSVEGLLYTTINAIWDLIDFKPRIPIEFKMVNEYYKCILPHDVTTTFVGKFPLIDEDLTDHLFEMDEIAYEKGRNYQWLV